MKITVFIDTCAFEQKNFDFENQVLKNIRRHEEQGYINLVTTEITIQEIKNRIGLQISNSKTAIEKMRKEAKILRNSELPELKNLFNHIEYGRVKKELLQKFDSFFSTTNTKKIPMSFFSLSRVFSKYLNETPPFGGKNKKHEFPDAFQLDIIENWARKNEIEVVVVSNDKDMKSACETSSILDHIESIDDLSTFVIKRYEEKLEKKIIQFIQRRYTKRMLELTKLLFQNLSIEVIEGETPVVSNIFNLKRKELLDIHLHDLRLLGYEDGDKKDEMRYFTVDFFVDLKFKVELWYYDNAHPINDYGEIILPKKTINLDFVIPDILVQTSIDNNKSSNDLACFFDFSMNNDNVIFVNADGDFLKI